MYLQARTQLLQRIRDDLHERADAGAFKDALLIRHLQRATEAIWDELTATVEGPGRVQEQRTIMPGDPAGYVPGSLVPMPSRWRRLVVVRRNGWPLEPGRVDRSELGQVPGRYWVDGPNQVTTLGLLAVSSAQLLTSEPWAQGDELDWIYIEQAPLWVDPSDATIDVVVDLASPEIADAVSAMAGARAVSRSDRDAYGKARAEFTGALQRMKLRSRDLHQRPRRAEDYQRRW